MYIHTTYTAQTSSQCYTLLHVNQLWNGKPAAFTSVGVASSKRPIITVTVAATQVSGKAADLATLLTTLP